MNIYLPIAEQSVNAFLLIGMGGIVGVLSGIFGIGGGFLLTPLLLFIGIPPSVAVASEAPQILGSSVSGFFAHWKRRNVDIKMGVVLVFAGLVGSLFGVWLFGLLQGFGHIDFFVRIAYVILLASVGSLMFWESLRAHLISLGKIKVKRATKGKKKRPLTAALPYKMRFRQSGIYISVLMPIILGFLSGVLAAILGIGGGFIMVPAMIYLLGMPLRLAVGTSLFQIIFVTANATFWQSGLNQSVDILLAILLLIGSVIGAQFGVQLGAKVDGVKIRIVLAIIVLAVCLSLVVDLLTQPANIYSIRTIL